MRYNIEDEFPEVNTPGEFMRLLKQERVVLYIQVDWSGPERGSRQVFKKALSEMADVNIPVCRIDCFDESKEYVIDWLLEQRVQYNGFNFHGTGEVLLVVNGNLVEFIAYPAKSGLDAVREKLNQWLNGPTRTL
ncbi:hypothetical protein [Paraflavitalea sp. CAU 1676]|uniref:hypothetical protein n=1 Tax=Paraflavitalea sp. CAU 1676 TaxID=3032598 RepID=UPI0023D9E4D0|nr:hypothetical protein [Paraflavitalea sp. CAU 1676]MDF2193364.1 hypothetical protein [Paraflavitalea sp. CAU 1676]